LSSFSICEALGDPESELFKPAAQPAGGLGFGGYFVASLGISSTFSAIAIGIWSEIGCGDVCIEALVRKEQYAFASVALSLAIALLLYVFDFFCPPHLPKQHFKLSQGDRFLGRFALLVAVGFFVAFCFLIVGDFPVVPLIVTVFLSPLTVLTFRWFIKPQDAAVETDPVETISGGHAESSTGARDDEGAGRPRDAAEQSPQQSAIEELRRIRGHELEQRNFYFAAALAFVCTGIACTAVFLVWAVSVDFKMHRQQSRREQELSFILWASPLGIAVSNFMFAMLMGLRVALHKAYASCDDVRSKLVVETVNGGFFQETAQSRRPSSRFTAKRPPALSDGPGRSGDHLQGKIDAYLERQAASTKRLMNVIKLMNAAFLVILSALFVTFQFAATGSYFAMLAQGFVAAMTLTFVVYTMVAFTRIWKKLQERLYDMPLWNSVVALATMDWARAFVVLFILPLLPVALVLSALNQSVRKARGLQQPRVRALRGEHSEVVGSALLTEKFAAIVHSLNDWNWLPIISWCYLWGYALVLYKLTPMLLNLLLAWMGSMMEGLHFALILCMTFAAGMVLFMLPPVPGPPIYLFGGFVISDKCPFGFAWGAVICILLCFVLKLTACAVQQKFIGGYLSTKMWVKRACGVHTPLMRAIERVLRRPGLSLGKVMILCGGPDWPTSVLAGILGISLFQCELGTCPIIANVIPLCLSGSFYLRRTGHGEIWARLGNFMFILTGVVSVVFWAGMAWAIQDEFDRSYALITFAREEFIDLEWLDYRASEIGKRCQVHWREVPRCILLAYITGVVGIAVVGHLFFWRSSMCFGAFSVDGDIEALQWYGERSLVRPLGAVGITVASACSLGLLIYRVWLARYTRLPAGEAACLLDEQESEWKASRRREAQRDSRRMSSMSLTLSVERSRSLEAECFGDMLEVSPTQPKGSRSRDLSDPCLAHFAEAAAPECKAAGVPGELGDDIHLPGEPLDFRISTLCCSPYSQASDAVSTPNRRGGTMTAEHSIEVLCRLPNLVCEDERDSGDAGDFCTDTEWRISTKCAHGFPECGLGGTKDVSLCTSAPECKSLSDLPVTTPSWSAGGLDSLSGSPSGVDTLERLNQSEPDLT